MKYFCVCSELRQRQRERERERERERREQDYIKTLEDAQYNIYHARGILRDLQTKNYLDM